MTAAPVDDCCVDPAAARERSARPRGLALTLSLAALVAVEIAASLLLSLATPNGVADTTLGSTRSFLSGTVSHIEDSWRPMASAVKSWRTHPHQPVYHRLLNHHRTKIQYPPSSFFLTLASERLAPRLGIAPFRVLDLLAWLACWTTIFASGWIFRRALAHSGSAEPASALQMALVLALAVLFYPLMFGFWLGQVQSLISACVAVSLALMLAGRPMPAGALIGVAALIKPHYALILAFLAWRRRWSAAAAGGLVLISGSLAALVVFGWGNHLDYLWALQLLARRGESYYANFSVNGLLHRIAGLTDPRQNNADWSLTFPPYVPWVYWGTVASSLLILAVVFLRHRPRPGMAAETADLSVALLGVTMASPIAWEHHYGILVPILAFAAARVWIEPEPRRRQRLGLLLALVWFLSATYLEPLVHLAHSRWNFLQSYLFFGAIAALGALVALARATESSATKAAS